MAVMNRPVQHAHTALPGLPHSTPRPGCTHTAGLSLPHPRPLCPPCQVDDFCFSKDSGEAASVICSGEPHVVGRFSWRRVGSLHFLISSPESTYTLPVFLKPPDHSARISVSFCQAARCGDGQFGRAPKCKCPRGRYRPRAAVPLAPRDQSADGRSLAGILGLGLQTSVCVCLLPLRHWGPEALTASPS